MSRFQLYGQQREFLLKRKLHENSKANANESNAALNTVFGWVLYREMN